MKTPIFSPAGSLRSSARVETTGDRGRASCPSGATNIALRGFMRAASVLCLLAFAAVLAPAQEKAREGELIYPRQNRGAEASAAAGREGTSSVTLLGLALVAAGVGGWLLWRQKNSPRGLSAKGQKLSVAETRSLGNRQYLIVADYDGRKFLLGVCPGRIEMLTPLGAGDDDLEAN